MHQWQNWSLANSDIAWLRGAGDWDKRSLAAILGLLMLSVGYVVAVLRGLEGRLIRWAPAGMLIACLVVLAFVMPRFANAPHYAEPDYRQAIEMFDQKATDGAALVTLDTKMDVMFNYQRRANHRYGMSGNEDLAELTPRVTTMIAEMVSKHDEIWIVAKKDRVSGVESTILATMPKTEEWVWGEIRLVHATK